MRNPREYAANRGKRVNPIHLKIRVAKKNGRATREEIAAVLREVARTGVEPPGWRVFAVNWQHPRSGGSGGALDLTAFRALIEHMAEQIQISPVKRTR